MPSTYNCCPYCRQPIPYVIKLNKSELPNYKGNRSKKENE